jgi:hypothetical protein
MGFSNTLHHKLHLHYNQCWVGQQDEILKHIAHCQLD